MTHEMTHEHPDPTDALIVAAAERGIVTATQRDAMHALQRELQVEARRAPSLESQGAPAQTTEAARGPNSVRVAYAIGAMLVVFAFGWFLADRWVVLGPWGVLSVAAAYASLLAGCSAWLERRGDRQASEVALTLVVTLAPVATWSALVIAGFWPADTQSSWLDDSNQWMSVCWAIIDLATLLAALLVFRWRPSVALTIPLTLMLWGLGLHLSRAIAGDALVGSLDAWTMLANGLLVCAVAGEVDRRQAKARMQGRATTGDMAFVFWLGGLLAFSLGYMMVWATAGAWRHLMVVVALILITLSLLLRRRTHLVFGLLTLFGYLAYLALDVFRNYLSLPAVLATLGILLILATVWVQRRFPTPVERVNAGRMGTALAPMITRGPFILAFCTALLSIIGIDEEVTQRAFRQRLRVLRQHSGSIPARASGSPTRTPPQRSRSTAPETAPH